MLDAIKLFVDIPGCFFIMGMDERAALQAVKLKYEKGSDEEHHQYLAKIIQLRFLMPAYSEKDIYEYITKLTHQFEDKRSVELLAAMLESNPREVKRTINIFAFSSHLAQCQNLVEPLNELLLTKVTVIQHCHPNLYDVLRQQPSLLQELEAYYHKKRETLLPDHMLTLYDLFKDMRHEDLVLLANFFGPTRVIPKGEGVQAAVEVAINLERDNRLHELFSQGKKQDSTLKWDDLENQISAGRKAKTPVPALSQPLLPFRSSEQLEKLFLYGEAEDGTHFADMEAQQLETYFSLTREMLTTSNLSNVSQPATDASLTVSPAAAAVSPPES